MKETTARKEPNPGHEYVRIYLPLEIQEKLERTAQDNNVSRGKLITQIIERYVNEPHEKEGESADVTIDERNKRLEGVRIAKKRVNQAEKRVKAVLTEPQATETKREAFTDMESEDSKTAAPDLDITVVGRTRPLTTRTKTILDIIHELEREEGEANVDKIMERAMDIGFSKDDVSSEMDRLTQTMEIYEPTRGSGNYLTSVRIKRTT